MENSWFKGLRLGGAPNRREPACAKRTLLRQQNELPTGASPEDLLPPRFMLPAVPLQRVTGRRVGGD
jgi:hypothetical protein